MIRARTLWVIVIISSIFTQGKSFRQMTPSKVMRMSFDSQSHRNPRIHGIGNHGLGGLLQAKTTDGLWKIIDGGTDGGCILDQAIAHVRAVKSGTGPHLENVSEDTRCVGLDLGTGTGRFARALVDSELCSSVVGIDSSRQMLKVAHDTKRERPIIYKLGNLFTYYSLPPADVITLSFVLHEMPAANVRILFDKAARALNTGGVIVVVDADPDGPMVLPRWYTDAWEPYMDEYRETFGEFVRTGQFAQYGLQMVVAERTVPGAACIWVFGQLNCSRSDLEY